MLIQPKKITQYLDIFLDTFFHLPTLLTMAFIATAILWHISDAGLHLAPQHIRLNTNHGNITFSWANGCCDLDW